MGYKQAVIVVNTYKKEAYTIASDVRTFLENRNISASFLDFSGPDESADFSRYDFAVTVGGDGTVLFAARSCFNKNIPIFPINLGEFGFIAGIQKDDWMSSLESFLEGKITPAERMMLNISVHRNNKTILETVALNDAVVSAEHAAKIVSLNISYNGNSFGHFKADGVIIASATGSTAYSAAAGGPIVDPELDVFVLSPICAFSLSNRPLVLPASGELCVEIAPSRGVSVMLTADGQVSEGLEEGDVVIVKKSNKKVLLVKCDSSVFYSALRSKLHWSGGPDA